MTTLGIILLQIITMFQPEAIVATGRDGQIVAVDFSQIDTRVQIHMDANNTESWISIATTYLSDEGDKHHSLRHIGRQGNDFVLTFDPLPTTTRIFDLIGDSNHRWLGVHSNVRAIHIPSVRPKFDENAIITDSIARIIQENSLEEVLSDDSIYLALRNRLPQLRDYIVWKWHLSPHEAFVLRQKQERPLPETASTTTTTATPSQPASDARIFVNSRMPQPRKSLFQRLFPKKEKEKHQPRPLSRFEQKTLQEMKR